MFNGHTHLIFTRIKQNEHQSPLSVPDHRHPKPTMPKFSHWWLQSVPCNQSNFCGVWQKTIWTSRTRTCGWTDPNQSSIALCILVLLWKLLRKHSLRSGCDYLSLGCAWPKMTTVSLFLLFDLHRCPRGCSTWLLVAVRRPELELLTAMSHDRCDNPIGVSLMELNVNWAWHPALTQLKCLLQQGWRLSKCDKCCLWRPWLYLARRVEPGPSCVVGNRGFECSFSTNKQHKQH